MKSFSIAPKSYAFLTFRRSRGGEWGQSLKRNPHRLRLAGRASADYLLPATSFWNLGFWRRRSKLGSILSQPGER